ADGGVVADRAEVVERCHPGHRQREAAAVGAAGSSSRGIGSAPGGIGSVSEVASAAVGGTASAAVGVADVGGAVVLATGATTGPAGERLPADEVHSASDNQCGGAKYRPSDATRISAVTQNTAPSA